MTKKAAKKEEKQEELQHKYLELQMLKQQISGMVEQKQAIDEKENEINATIEALRGIDTIKKGDEIWSSMGSGAFIRSDIKDIEKVLIAVGAGVVSKETIPRAIEILEGRAKEINSIGMHVIEQATSLVERINELEPQVQKLAQEVE